MHHGQRRLLFATTKMLYICCGILRADTVNALGKRSWKKYREFVAYFRHEGGKFEGRQYYHAENQGLHGF